MSKEAASMTAHTIYFALQAAQRMLRFEAELTRTPDEKRVAGTQEAVRRLKRLYQQALKDEEFIKSLHAPAPDDSAPVPVIPDDLRALLDEMVASELAIDAASDPAAPSALTGVCGLCGEPAEPHPIISLCPECWATRAGWPPPPSAPTIDKEA